MADYDFDKPVRVMLGNVAYLVTNTRQAGELLMFKWPTEGGKKARAARHALLIAMEAKHDTQLIKQARRAFAEAAAEAGIRILD